MNKENKLYSLLQSLLQSKWFKISLLISILAFGGFLMFILFDSIDIVRPGDDTAVIVSFFLGFIISVVSINLLINSLINKKGITILDRNTKQEEMKISPIPNLKDNPNEKDIVKGTIMTEEKVIESVSKRKYRYWSYDDEYISGGQYFWRGLLATTLCLVLVGFYLLSVVAYKRARSLGFTKTGSSIWAVWAVVSIPLGFIPTSLTYLTNTIPHLFLWFTNGPGQSYPKKEEVL